MNSRPKKIDAFARDVAAARNRIIGLLNTQEPTQVECKKPSTPSLPDLRWAPQDPEASEAEMIKAFSPKVLLATHCFEVGEGDAPRLILGLRQPNSPVLLIFDDSEAVVDIVAEGRPRTASCAAVACLRNLQTRRRIQANFGAVIGAQDLQHVIAWARLGLAAVPLAEIISTIDLAPQFWKLFTEMRLPVPHAANTNNVSLKGEPLDQKTQSEPLPAVLVVADWDPLSCQRLTDKSAIAIEHLTWLSTVDPSQEVGIWAPTDMTLHYLQKSLAANDMRQVTAILLHSILHGLQRVLVPSVETTVEARQPKSLNELRRQVSSDARRGLDPLSAVRDYLDQVEEELVNPALRAESDAGAANDRVLRLVEAGLLRRFAEIDIAVVRDQASAVSGPLLSSHGAELINLAKLILEIARTRHGGRHGSRGRRG